MKIPLNSFKREYEFFKTKTRQAVGRVLASGWYILGKECENFERELSEYLHVPYVVTVANGTDAITLSLRAHGISKGDEVITTSMTAYPTIVGIVESGATPVVIDIVAETGLMDISKIESAITARTKAIMPVHMYGQACDMDSILKIAKKRKLIVIEDCAQSIGAQWKGKVTGSFGASATFSFYPTKNLGAYGDGGAVVTKFKSVYEKLLMLRNYGQRVRYYHDEKGQNSRLDEIQAAILRVKLRELEHRINRRREIADYYNNHLKNVFFINEQLNAKHTYHLFVIRHKRREKLAKYLADKGIGTLIHYPVPVHKQKAYEGRAEVVLPVVESFTQEILSIPMFPELTSREVQYVVNVINSFVV